MAFRSVLPRRPLGEATVCPLCDRVGCKGTHPDPVHLTTYPFLPGGVDPLANVETITATARVFDPDTGILVYGPGEAVPIDEARRLGLTQQAVAVPSVALEDEPKPKTSKKTPVRTRAPQKPQEMR